MLMNLIVEPEFQNKIPPLTEDEFNRLEELILSDGRVNEPIKVWNKIIVDGHHRWKIVQKHPEIPFEVKEMDFADKWSAFDWMYQNQLGRRNLTEKQRRYLIGKLYEARKHTHGAEKGGRGNQYTKVVSDEIRNLPKPKNGVIRQQVADEMHIGTTQVTDSYHFAKGIDAIRKVNPQVADDILTGEKKASKGTVQEIGRADPEDAGSLVDELLNKKAAKKETVNRPGTGATSENRKLSREVREIIGGMSDDTPMEYTIDNLTEQIGFNADAFIRVISNLIMDHRDICDEHRMEVGLAICEVISKIEKIKERLNDGTQL